MPEFIADVSALTLLKTLQRMEEESHFDDIVTLLWPVVDIIERGPASGRWSYFDHWEVSLSVIGL